MPSRCSRRDRRAWSLSALKSQRCSIYRLCPTPCGTRSMASIRGKHGWSRLEHVCLSMTCLARPVKWEPCLHHKPQLVSGCTHLEAAVSTATYIIDSRLPSTAA